MPERIALLWQRAIFKPRPLHGNIMSVLSRLAFPLVGAVAVSAIGAGAFLWYRSTQTVRESAISTSRFGDVRVLLPAEEAQGFALYLAKANEESPELALTLAQLGFAVGIVDGDAYLSVANNEQQDDCLLFSGELTRLAQVVQKNSRLPHLFPALLVGDGAGAAVAVAALAQSPKDFKGALVRNFCPRLPVKQPLCEENGFSSRGVAPYNLLPPKSLDKPILVWNEPGLDCDRGAWEGFVAKLSKISLKEKLFASAELARFIRGGNFFERHQAVGAIAELPIVDLLPDGEGNGDLVVFLSGDGGWATIDKEVGEALRAAGATVVGFDTLRYFWKHKSAQQAALDLERILLHYVTNNSFKRISLIGFSFGADVLPAMVNLLDDEMRTAIHRIILLNPGLSYDFEVNLTDWLNIAPTSQNASIADQLKRIPSQQLVCIFTSDERDESVCPAIQPQQGKSLEFKGDHHFDGDYKRLARDIIQILHNPE